MSQKVKFSSEKNVYKPDLIKIYNNDKRNKSFNHVKHISNCIVR